jgi:hypothetical protein
LAHRAYPDLPNDHLRSKAGKAIAEGVEDPNIKIYLLLGGQKKVNEPLRHVLKLQAVLLADRPPQETSTRIFWGSRSRPTGRRDPKAIELQNL